jgi:hypothetical protein
MSPATELLVTGGLSLAISLLAVAMSWGDLRARLRALEKERDDRLERDREVLVDYGIIQRNMATLQERLDNHIAESRRKV